MIWEVSPTYFIILTVVIGGAAAFMTGRAIAGKWGSNAILAFYVALLTAAIRFLHFALFDGSLLSPYYYLVDFIVLLAIAFAGKAMTRRSQMAEQYGFRFRSPSVRS